jgi:hypothetical protein
VAEGDGNGNMHTDGHGTTGPSRRLVIATAVWVAGSALAFLLLNVILAAFLVIMGLTVLVVAYVARDWEQHSSFEEREMARARKRAQKWEKNKDARDRDRARWEAHQARRAAKQAGRESGR